jgi:uncharacterized delta-60 repeat protein
MRSPCTLRGAGRRLRRAAVCGAGLVLGVSSAVAQTPAPGTLDVSFGGQGWVVTPMSTIQDRFYDIAVDSAGRLVAAGYTSAGYSSGNGLDFVVARYLPSGALDPSFGSGGIVTTAMGSEAADDLVQAVLIQPDGRIVAAGYSHNGAEEGFAIARYNTDGTLDTLFGGTGKIITNLGAYMEAHALALQPDGKLLVAGQITRAATGTDVCLVRYYANGARDLAFGGTGLVAPAVAGHQRAVDVALTSNGRILVAETEAANSAFVLVRFHPDGTPDWSLGPFGVVSTSFGAGYTAVHGLAVQSDGKIVLAGMANGDLALARYLSTGYLDVAFDGDGKLTLELSPTSTTIADVRVQQNGKIVVAGGASYDAALIRFDVDGTPDTGLVLTPLGEWGSGFNGLALQADGKIVAAGWADIPGYDNYELAVARYWGDTIDLIFADGFDGS